MNSINIIGRITRDPEMRTFEKSQKATTGIAVDKYVKDGEKQTSFFEVQAWGKTAETLKQYCPKGTAIGIIGHLVQETWTDRTTQEKRSKIVIVMDRLCFLPANKKKEESSSGGSGGDASLDSIFSSGDDEIPF